MQANSERVEVRRNTVNLDQEDVKRAIMQYAKVPDGARVEVYGEGRPFLQGTINAVTLVWYERIREEANNEEAG